MVFRPKFFHGFIALSAAPATLFAVHQHQFNKEEPSVNVEKLQTPAEDNFRRKEQKAREIVYKYMFMAITGAPGLSIGITKNGKPLWSEGFGFADVEIGAPCTGESVMRIASISKPITAAVAARLVERAKLNLDKSIHEYLSEEEFPRRTFNGKPVEITTRQLLSHTSGVRHYPKKDELAPDSEDPVEFMSNNRFNSVLDALAMFKADPLLSEPGTEYHYTTHGYTLLSAVLEKAAGGSEFRDQLRALFRRLDMRNTFLDDAQEPVVVHRTRYYKRNEKTHRLENVREVDNSYKLAGGGILSNVGDLLKFGNAILYSYQYSNEPVSLLKPETVKKLWTKNSEHWANGKKLAEYGLGWCLADPNEWDKEEIVGKNGTGKSAAAIDFDKRKYWFHTGGAVGTSSILLIKPAEQIESGDELPRGTCVAILVNCQNCSCLGLAVELAALFGDE